jgi:hypothetical protein
VNCVVAELNARAEALASEILRRSRQTLGTPMARVAQRLGIDVEAMHLPYRRGVASPEERAILYKPSGYGPRDEFTIAHELMELHLPRTILDLDARVKEKFCNRGAAALLLPQQQFLFSLHGTGWDLPELRRRWPWASWGAIATRLVDLVPGVSASTWVNGRREWWRYQSIPERQAFGAELDAMELLGRERHRGRAVARRSSAKAFAWRLTARDGRRVAVTVARG